MIKKKEILLVFSGIFFVSFLFSQDKKPVLLFPISDDYEGETRRGLAHGEGTASGMDKYEGEFKKGLPNGEGTYYYHTGEVYEGEWRKGKREGYGKLSFEISDKDSVLEGYWYEDRFLGDKKRPDPAYKILSNINIARNNIYKLNDHTDQVVIKFETIGRSPYDILFQESSGVYTIFDDKTIIFESIDFPFTLNLRYKILAPGMTNFFDCRLKVLFNEEGSWQVKLYN